MDNPDRAGVIAEDFLEALVDTGSLVGPAAAELDPFGAKLGAVLSSDISHFDVLDMTEVLEEGGELVEEKGMSEEEFQAFTFGNPVNLWASLNPDFFKGTVVESQVRKLQAQGGQA